MIEEEHSVLIENTERYIEWKDLKIDNRSKRAYCCNKEISVSPKAYKILEFLVRNPDTVFSREGIINSVWDKRVHIGHRAIDVHMSELRKALKPDNFCKVKIRTARSFGYSIEYKNCEEL
ncbi:winged helix-turn-helix domain-containing protein [Gammaproteobacteria bacterium]|nr:winged helix-turn-helix domain-containing protein [Gammaproteobacteria bacterium]MDC0089205.1 winged helix-turn-helix domain-containing protein [Gammaproteobacteria bacterium]